MANRANGEGTIYEETARSRWVGQLYVEGRRRKVTAHTRAEVVDKINALKARSVNGEPAGDGNATVADAVRRWRERELPPRERERDERDGSVTDGPRERDLSHEGKTPEPGPA